MTYELVAVSRGQHETTAPTFVELGPIVAPSIAWTSNRGRPAELRFSCLADRLPANIRSRVAGENGLRDNPTEVRLYRDGVLVFAGPWLNFQCPADGALSAFCADALWYASRWLVDADLTFAGVDQFTIAATLVDQWQDLDYGNFGIDTSGVGTSGITRDATYLAVERHPVLQRIYDLGARENGFDVWVTPERELMLATTRGSDLSDAIVLDFHDITDASVSVDVSQVASDAYGTGTSTDNQPITSLQSDAAVRALWGRTAAAETFDGVSQQVTLDDHTTALLDRQKRQWFQPGAGLHPVADVDVDSFDVGDWVSYSFDVGLGLHTGVYRVAAKQVTVDDAGQEAIAVEFE